MGSFSLVIALGLIKNVDQMLEKNEKFLVIFLLYFL